MNNLTFKIVGYYSFLTKRVYKTKTALKGAETKTKNALEKKYSKILEKAKQVINEYKNYALYLLKQKPSFLRWSNIRECIIAIKKEKYLLPKILRSSLNYKF